MVASSSPAGLGRNGRHGSCAWQGAMLRITSTRRAEGTAVALEGRLAGPWMDELARAWKSLTAAQDARSVSVLCAAPERGIPLIDTAPAYGQGRSEEIVGKAVARWGRRERVVLATKVGLEWRNGGVARNATRARIRQEIGDSLKRLRTDYVDLYQVHWPDPLVPIEETAETLHALYREGRIRAIGVSNYSPEQMDLFRQVAPLHSAQPPYNLFEREAEERVLPYCLWHGIATLTYGALCRGLLSGRMRADTRFGGDDLRRTDPKFQPPRYAQYLRAVATLEHLARARYGRSVLATARRYCAYRSEEHTSELQSPCN